MKHTLFVVKCFITFVALTSVVEETDGTSAENDAGDILAEHELIPKWDWSLADDLGDFDLAEVGDIATAFNYPARGDIFEQLPKWDLSLAEDDGDFDLAEVMALARSNVKKDPDAYSRVEKMAMVHLHNVYRSNLTRPIPKGSDVMYAEWNDTLARAAEDWLKDCRQANRDANNATEEVRGQNVYQGPSKLPSRPVWTWYREYQDYFFNNFTCNPERQCGHALQVLWHDSAQIGCARKSTCFPRESNDVLVNCLYQHPGNVRSTGIQVFKYGWQCTRCEAGQLCYRGLCVEKRTCKLQRLDCECKLSCKNCARPDRKSCRCEPCKPGWDWPDCSFPCRNAIDVMKKAGFCRWKSKTLGLSKFCESRHVRAACRMECGLCKPSLQAKNSTADRDLCCEGKLCPPYHVLDKSCNCKVDCPSNLCLYPPSTTSTTKVPSVVRKTTAGKKVRGGTTTKRPKSKKVEVPDSAGNSRQASLLLFLCLLLNLALLFFR